MPDNRLLQHASNPNTATPGDRGAFEYGNNFQVVGSTFLQEVSWYRPAVPGEAQAPAHLRVWNRDTSALVYEVSPIPDNSTVGWQRHTLTTEVALSSGVNYIVSLGYPSGGGMAYRSSSPAVATPFVPHVNFVSFSAIGTNAIPTSAYDGDPEFIGCDVGIGAVSGGDLPTTDPPAGTGSGATTGDLAAWLSTTVGNQSHSAPLQTQALAAGGSGFAAIKSVVDTIATSVGTGLGTAVSAIGTAVGTANTALVHAATTWSDALATALQNMSDDFASFGASKPAQGGGDFGTGTFPSNVGTLVWTMLAETDFAGDIAWAQPADVYVLSITTRPIGLPLNLTDGVHTIYRCGWWTPLNGSFGRQRRYIDFEDNHLESGAERLPGILVSLQPGGEGHLQAWALT